MAWLSLTLALMLLLSASRMLLASQSFIGPGRMDATNPRTVRAFGWFFFVLGVLPLGAAVTKLVEG
jgi:hypothetical protein